MAAVAVRLADEGLDVVRPVRASWGGPNSYWYEFADGNPRRLKNGVFYVGRPQSPFLRREFVQRCKRKQTRKVSPSQARFERKRGLR
jgi:hypothetical protein